MKIIDKTTGRDIGPKYHLNEYGDIVCKSNGAVLMNSEDFEIKMDLKDFVLMLKETAKNVRHKAVDVLKDSEDGLTDNPWKAENGIMNIQFKDVSPLKSK